jgi:thiol-disulfide isomerase/thioredoxin
MRTLGIRVIFRVLVAGALVHSASPSLYAMALGDDAFQESVSGVWTGAAQVNARDIPFQLEISGAGDQVRGALVNGKERSAVSSGIYSNGHLVLHFDYYANTLDATVRDGVLTGTFGGHAHSIPITAHRNGKRLAAAANPPHIGGVWNVAVDNGSKGERSWKLRVRQTGPSVDAVIERIDGDTGDLYGVWRDGAFTVSHFTAAGPTFAVLRPQSDGTLQVETAAHGGGVQVYTANRVTSVHTAALETLDDPLHHTSMKNPNEPLPFRFPDLSGTLVSNTDPEFVHKALIVAIGGSWCPNCQDEAPFLETLYRKYHSQGLEIVELSFEEASQLENPTRLRAVMKRYGITYRVLIAGTPDQLTEKVPHVENLNCWPTTFFVGRDGLVKTIHTGYAGPATGGDNRALEEETTKLVERLLGGKESPKRSKPVQVARTQ